MPVGCAVPSGHDCRGMPCAATHRSGKADESAAAPNRPATWRREIDCIGYLLARAQSCRPREQNRAMRAESRAIAAILTVLLHLTVILALLHVTAIAERPPPPRAGQPIAADRLHGGGEQVV